MSLTMPGHRTRKAKVLVVDTDPIVLRAAAEILSREGYQVVALDDAVEGLSAVKDPTIDVACLDLQMPSLFGMDLLRAFKECRPDVEVIMMSSFATVETAVEAVKGGAYDSLTKPFGNLEVLSLAVGRAAEKKALQDRTKVLEEALAARDQLEVPYAQAKKLVLRAFEQRYLSGLLERSGNNVSMAARAAGVDRSNFRRLLKQYEVGGRTMKGPDGDEGDFDEAASG